MIKIEVTLYENGSLIISGTAKGEPMEADEILDCLDEAVFALEGQKESVR